MAWIALLVLLAGLVAAWYVSGVIARHDRGVLIAVGCCLALVFAWLALAHCESLFMRLIPWDDFVFFQDLPLDLALLLWLALCIRRLQGFVRAMTGLLAVIFALYSVAVVSGPVWLPLYLPRLQGNVRTADYTQSTGWSCAPAALAEALRRKGIPATERQVAILAASSPLQGTTDWGIVRAAHRLGVPGARVLRPASWSDLLAAPKPALAEWYLGEGVAHMITITAARGDQVWVLDPLLGDQSYTRSQFEAQWMGGLILLP